MAYPRYKAGNSINEKNRMMPPLCSLRIGELFGNDSKNLLGFLDGLSFNWPDDTTWEVENGQRVPKQCDVTVGYTVIHRKPPSGGGDNIQTTSDEFFGFGFK